VNTVGDVELVEMQAIAFAMEMATVDGVCLAYVAFATLSINWASFNPSL